MSLSMEIEIGRGKPFGGRKIFARRKKLFDRRAEKRADPEALGLVHFDGGSCRECVVETYSDAGARLSTGCSRSLPPEVILEIPAMKRKRMGRVIWRRGPEVGVRFC